MKCPKCGEEQREGANFCWNCRTKLREVCDCWVKKRPYNCGQKECPGLMLLVMELKKEPPEE